MNGALEASYNRAVAGRDAIGNGGALLADAQTICDAVPAQGRTNDGLGRAMYVNEVINTNT